MSIFSLKNYCPNIKWYNFGDHWMLNIFVISNPPAKKVSLAPLYKLHWQLIWHGLVLKVKVVSENIMWTFRNFCPIKHFVPHIKLLTQFVQVPLFNGFWLYIFILFYLKFFIYEGPLINFHEFFHYLFLCMNLEIPNKHCNIHRL